MVSRTATTIRKRQDGVYEMFSRIISKKTNNQIIGDKKTDEPIVIHYDNFDDYADRSNYWGGYSSTMIFHKSGLEEEVNQVRKIIAELDDNAKKL